MSDVLGKFFAIMVAILVFLIAPLYGISQKQDAIVQGVVYNITVEFVDEVLKQGKITQDMYMRFVSKLDSTDLLYDIEITHSHDNVQPKFDSDGNVIGTKNVTDIMYTSQILDSIYTENKSGGLGEGEVDAYEGMYLMSKGDSFSVTVSNKEPTLSQKIASALFGSSSSGKVIYATYGGVIRDENY